MPAPLRPVLNPLNQDLNPTPNSNYPAPGFLWMRADALEKMEKTLMLGGIGAKRRRGRQRMR